MDCYRFFPQRTDSIIVTVDSGVTVTRGDLMFLDNTDNLRNDGDSTATDYAYPFSYHRISGASLALNKASVKDYFLGVAFSDFDGVNNTLKNNCSIATIGRYVYDLKPAKTVGITDYWGASGTTAASDLSNTLIMKVSDTALALGYFKEVRTHALSAEIDLRTAFSIVNRI